MKADASLVPLPSPQAFRADVQRMVDFGPRLPGYEGHEHFCSWLIEVATTSVRSAGTPPEGGPA